MSEQRKNKTLSYKLASRERASRNVPLEIHALVQDADDIDAIEVRR